VLMRCGSAAAAGRVIKKTERKVKRSTAVTSFLRVIMLIMVSSLRWIQWKCCSADQRGHTLTTGGWNMQVALSATAHPLIIMCQSPIEDALMNRTNQWFQSLEGRKLLSATMQDA